MQGLNRRYGVCIKKQMSWLPRHRKRNRNFKSKERIMLLFGPWRNENIVVGQPCWVEMAVVMGDDQFCRGCRLTRPECDKFC